MRFLREMIMDKKVDFLGSQETMRHDFSRTAELMCTQGFPLASHSY